MFKSNSIPSISMFRGRLRMAMSRNTTYLEILPTLRGWFATSVECW